MISGRPVFRFDTYLQRQNLIDQLIVFVHVLDFVSRKSFFESVPELLIEANAVEASRY